MAAALVIEVRVREDMSGKPVLPEEPQQAPRCQSSTGIDEDFPDEVDVDQVRFQKRYPRYRVRYWDGSHAKLDLFIVFL
jgi:hypothetical protein